MCSQHLRTGAPTTAPPKPICGVCKTLGHRRSDCKVWWKIYWRRQNMVWKEGRPEDAGITPEQIALFTEEANQGNGVFTSVKARSLAPFYGPAVQPTGYMNVIGGYLVGHWNLTHLRKWTERHPVGKAVLAEELEKFRSGV